MIRVGVAQKTFVPNYLFGTDYVPNWLIGTDYFKKSREGQIKIGRGNFAYVESPWKSNNI